MLERQSHPAAEGGLGAMLERQSHPAAEGGASLHLRFRSTAEHAERAEAKTSTRVISFIGLVSCHPAVGATPGRRSGETIITPPKSLRALRLI
jgi:hypothetical protein